MTYLQILIRHFQKLRNNMEHQKQNTNNYQNKQAIEEIIKKVKSLMFGQLNITVHHGKIMQVDVTEKLRFNKLPLQENGSGI